MTSQKIDINSADLEELESLTGVGRAKAEAIIDVRKTSGGFSELSDLLKIPGVGPCLLELNRGVLECVVRASTSGACTKTTAPQSTRKRERETRSSKNEVTKPEEKVDKLSEAASRVNPARPKAEKTRSESSTRPPMTRSNRHLAYRDMRAWSSDESDQDGETGSPRDRKSPATSEAGSPAASKSPASSVDLVPHRDSEDGDVREHKVEMLTRTRIMSASEKHWMKRKCEAGGSKGHSPGKKPCRHSDTCHHSSDEECSSSLAQALRSSTAASMRKQKIPSRSNPPPEMAAWLTTFQVWSHAERLLALDQLMEQCEPAQVRHVMGVIEPQFQRDFISLLPKELALYVLSFLDPRDLLQAAQTCRYWCVLAEDNLLWREKCQEESIDEELVYGSKVSGSVSARRSRARSSRSYSGSVKGGPPWKGLYMRQVQIERNWRSAPLPAPELLKGHDDHVITCLEFCGNRIVSGSDDNTLKVWSAITGKCLRTLVGHTGGVWSSQMSDSVVISGSTDRTLKVWNVDTGQCVHTLYGHTSTVRCMHLCGNIVVSGSRDATLRMWDISSGQCVHVLMGHVAAVRCVQYDSRRVVSGAYDYMVKVWDPDTETCLHTLQGHSNRVYSLQFDGVHIVSGSLDTSIRVWDVESGNCLHTLIGHQSLTSGMELKDNTLVSGNADSTVKVWDITTGQCLQTLQGTNKHQSAVTCLQFNKRFVITSSDDGTVKIWDVKTGEFLRNLVALDSGGSGGVVWRIRCSNTRLVCAVGSRNGTEETKLMVLNFDIDDDAGVASPQQPSSPETAAISS